MSDLPADAPGPLLAAGRVADVYDLGDGTVLRRCRGEHADLHREARVMAHVREHGYPVPAVHRVEGRDLVMDKVDGPTMYDALRRTPWKALWYARRLARLQHRLARIEAPTWLLAPGVALEELGHAQSVLHLDLHPKNVIMSPRHGPTVIDWGDAAAGPAGFDGAISYVEMATFPAVSPRERFAHRLLVEGFRRFRGRPLIDPYVVPACDHRLADPGIEPDERVAVAELRKRHG